MNNLTTEAEMNHIELQHTTQGIEAKIWDNGRAIAGFTLTPFYTLSSARTELQIINPNHTIVFV